MQPSPFNIYYHDAQAQTTIVLNSWSRKLCRVPLTDGLALESGGDISAKSMPTLRSISAVVDDPETQTTTAITAFESEKHHRDELTIVLPLTNRCNFACTYCYQVIHGEYRGVGEHSHGKWTAPAMSAVVAFVDKELQRCRYSRLRVRWYGGEPLLRPDLLSEFAASFRTVCDPIGVELVGTVISNGYLLTCDTRSTLINAGVDRIEISIDGPKQFHDTLRESKDKRSTYDTILRQVVEAVSDIPTVVLRVNVHQDTADNICPWLVEIAETIRHPNLYLKFKLVESRIDEGLEWDDFASHLTQYHFLANSLGLQLIRRNLETELCPAIRDDYFIIQQDLKVYKCPQNLGGSYNVGSIDVNEGEFQETQFLRYWSEYSVENDICATCNHLPHCNGGCPYNVIMGQINRSDLEVYSRKEGCCVERSAPEQLLIRAL